jgi:IMP dehydrogenase
MGQEALPGVQVIGGNVTTAEVRWHWLKQGPDGVKVGQGPGSIAPHGWWPALVPQITAVANVALALKASGVPLIADGGIRFSGDFAKAIAAGAWSVMIGSLFAGTEEAPGDVELYQGRSYKSYRGMGSIGAMQDGSRDRYFQADIATDKLVPEGIEGRVPYKGSLAGVVHQLLGGLRSSMGYGCATIESFAARQNSSVSPTRVSGRAMRTMCRSPGSAATSYPGQRWVTTRQAYLISQHRILILVSVRNIQL